MMYAYVGCRTSAWRGARGKGIEVYQVLPSGEWRLIQRVESVQENPSWLTLDPLRDRLYALHGDGDVVAGLGNKVQAAMAAVTPQSMLAEQHRKMAEPGSGD